MLPWCGPGSLELGRSREEGHRDAPAWRAGIPPKQTQRRPPSLGSQTAQVFLLQCGLLFSLLDLPWEGVSALFKLLSGFSKPWLAQWLRLWAFPLQRGMGLIPVEN